MKNGLLSTAEAAKYIGYSYITLWRWERRGILVPAYTSPYGRRYYAAESLAPFIRSQLSDTRVIIKLNERDGDKLAQMIKITQEFCRLYSFPCKIMLPQLKRMRKSVPV